MNEFLDKMTVTIRKILDRCEKVANNEQASKDSLIKPFFSALGYDTEDPDIWLPEYNADFAGKKPEVSKITEATMRGEIKDFSESLRQRVALLKGVSVSVLESVYKERLRPNPGAMKLLRTANSLGLHTLLVSGGFTFFTDKLQEELGFTQAKANTLEIQNGLLTGNVLGDIVDDVGKAAHLDNACKIVGCSKLNTVTIGDGANDLLMMTGSGLSIAYRAKPVVKEKADVAFDYVDLDAALVLIT